MEMTVENPSSCSFLPEKIQVPINPTSIFNVKRNLEFNCALKFWNEARLYLPAGIHSDPLVLILARAAAVCLFYSIFSFLVRSDFFFFSFKQRKNNNKMCGNEMGRLMKSVVYSAQS